jgi:hypothetical protein
VRVLSARHGAVDEGIKVCLGAQCAKRMAPVATQSGITEGGKHGRRGRLVQQRGLHGERHVLRQAARFHFGGHDFHAGGQRGGQPVQRGVGAFGRGQLVRQCGGGICFAQARSRSMAMMLPAPSQMEFSGISR